MYISLGVFPRVLIAMLALSLFGSALLADTTAIEREFAREQKALACVNGSTDEPSCSGTDMDVYLRGDEVRKLDWWVEKSNQWVREEYFFRGTRPVLVIETIEKKYDSTQSLCPSHSWSHAHVTLRSDDKERTNQRVPGTRRVPIARFSEQPFFIFSVSSPTHLTNRCSQPPGRCEVHI